MRYPNFNEEKKLWKKGYKRVVGIDEAGRGSLAGPVFAVAVILNSKYQILKLKEKTEFRSKILKEVKDSKKLSPNKREKIYKILIDNPCIEWRVSKASEKVIDKINILEATKLAMERAVKKIQKSNIKNQNDKSKLKIDYLILDGNIKLDLPLPQKSIINADEKVFSCAAASIIAKVKRDMFMRKLHKKHPKYNFDIHKGYGTKMHRKALKKYGYCKVHRMSFRPLKNFKT